MVSADRDGLARVIRDAYAVDIIPADTLLSDEGWSGLVGSVEEWHPEADAALAYLAARESALPCHQGVRGCTEVSEHYHPDEKYAKAGRNEVQRRIEEWFEDHGTDHSWRYMAEQIAALGVTR